MNRFLEIVEIGIALALSFAAAHLLTRWLSEPVPGWQAALIVMGTLLVMLAILSVVDIARIVIVRRFH